MRYSESMPHKGNRLPPEVLEELSGLTEREGEYVSHVTALSLLGAFPEPCVQLTLVSRRRRRNRMLGNMPLVFVTHGSGRPVHTQAVLVGKSRITVSTIEQTLVDLFADLDHAPDLETLAGILACLPFQADSLLQMAAQTSDTVLKRIAFMLCWSGRADHPDLPPTGMTRTPVMLDPRADAPYAWDGRFFIRYPSFLLAVPLPRPIADDSPEMIERLNFRNHPAVRDHVARTEYLPLYNNNDSVFGDWLDGFVRAILLPSAHVSLHGVLTSFADREPFERQSVPRLVTRYIEERPHLLDSRRSEILSWVRGHLDARGAATAEAVVRIAFAMGFHEVVLSGISRHGSLLFGAGRVELLQKVSRRYLESEHRLPARLFIIAANIAARENRFDDGLALLDRGKSFFEGLDGGEADFGELAFETGELLRRSGRLTESMAELSLARECFISAKLPDKVADADDALGKLMIMRERPEEARRYFLSALSAAWSSRSVPEQAGILENLALVEHDIGNPRRAAPYLSRAISLYSMLGNRAKIASAGLSLGVMHLSMGHMTKAFRLFKDVHAAMEKIGHVGGTAEAAAYLGWTCDLLGKQGAANSWWSMIPAAPGVEPRVRHTVERLRAMSLLLHDDASGALSVFQALLPEVQGSEFSSSDAGDITFGIAVCMARLGMPDAHELFSRALDRMSATPHRIQSRQSRILPALLYPKSFSGPRFVEDMRCYPGTNCFDPFWYIYADPLAKLESADASALLDHLVGKTPPDLLVIFRRRDKVLDRLLKTRETMSTRASQFVTLIRNGQARPLHTDDYTTWRRAVDSGTFIFDGPSGEIRFGRSRTILKPSSIPHRILVQLFLAFPNPVDSPSLYASAWGIPFDPDCDQAAFKSAILRLSTMLRTVYPGVSLSRSCMGTGQGFGVVSLNLPCAWEAVI